MRRSKKTSKLRVTGLYQGNSLGTGEFPAQRARTAENVFIWWRHHGFYLFDLTVFIQGISCSSEWRIKLLIANNCAYFMDRAKLETTKWIELDCWYYTLPAMKRINYSSFTWQTIHLTYHDDVIKWKHFPRNWPFVRGIHRSRWIPHTKASDAELWCFLWSGSE